MFAWQSLFVFVAVPGLVELVIRLDSAISGTVIAQSMKIAAFSFVLKPNCISLVQELHFWCSPFVNIRHKNRHCPF